MSTGPGLKGVSPASLGIPHTMSVDSQTGTAQLSVPIEVVDGRDGFGPSLSLEYRPGGGNTVFGRGWNLAGLLSFGIDTSERLPRYLGDDDFSFSGAGRLVPFIDETSPDGAWQLRPPYRVRRYRPMRERNHVRIERFVRSTTGDSHWRVRDARNSVSVFGAREDGLSRIADPLDPARTFNWLPELQLDSRGNAIRYDYVAENLDGVDRTAPSEHVNFGAALPAQRYLKRIRWGNSAPVLDPDADLGDQTWHFELVLDYGDHDEDDPQPEADREWPVRPDAWTVASPGFPVRTYRLCRRLLLFHRFDELGDEPVLVHSYVLEHELAPEGSRLVRLRRVGRRAGLSGVETRERPPLDFAYSRPRVGDSFAPVPSTAGEQVPHGLDGPRYRLVDLWGEGISGLLIESTGAWFYRRNLGGGRFGTGQLVIERPSHSVAQVTVHDFDGDGDTELTVLAGRSAGYYAYDRNSGLWTGFQPFGQFPHLDSIASVRWFDADGDGRADLVTGLADRLSLYRSLGRDGFEPATDITQVGDAKGAPWRVDQQNDFFFADMTGDGLADQVLLKNGVVIYWPNSGYGRFGAPVTMDGAPRFAPDGEFDAGRVIFADIDGSGTSDILYIGNGEITVWTNACGNRLLEPRRITGLPHIDRKAGLAVFDFLGNGTPCLVWSTHSANGFSPLQYLPLTDGIRPNLLEKVTNNLGLEQRLEYSSTAAHYLRDQGTGSEWGTKLPKHHLVVDRYEIADRVTSTRTAKTFLYHDGSYDGRRRTVRGFGYVETADVELSADEATDLPQTAGSWTRQWFHLGGEGVSSRQAMWRGDNEAPECRPYLMESGDALSTAEALDAAEAVTGLVVRRETFALEGTGPASTPLRVENHGILVRRLQPASGKRPASFETLERESQIIVYEGNAGDPRIRHQLVLDSSPFGTPLITCDVAYPRRESVPAADPSQRTMLVRARRLEFLDVDSPHRLELALPLSEEVFSIEDPAAPTKGVYLWEELKPIVTAALIAPEPFDAGALSGGKARRLHWSRTFYWNAAGDSALAFGQASSPPLVHHVENAAFPPSLVAQFFGAGISDARLTALGYVLKDGHWWRPGETTVFGPRGRFRRIETVRRTDGGETAFDYDSSSMRVVAVTDAVGNRTELRFDYHLLQPQSMVDPNGTVSEVRHDALGVVVASSAHGKVRLNGAAEDYGFAPLSGLAADLHASLEQALADPAGHVGDAAETIYYDLSRWAEHGEPTAVLSLKREALVHQGDGAAPAEARDEEVATTISYFDGFGRTLQSKLRVGPGPAIARAADGSLIPGPDGSPTMANAAARWQVSGHRLHDQRQQPIQTFEPFFSGTARYEGDQELARFGSSTSVLHDSLGRTVRQDVPNGTFSKIEHGAWSVRNFDENDTVGQSAYRLTRAALAASNPERRALVGALAHDDTPVTTHFDPAGRSILTEEADGIGGTRTARILYAPDGHPAANIDARGIRATERWRDMLGRELRARSSDSGEALLLPDAMDRPVECWDARGTRSIRSFDRIDRPTALDVELPGVGLRRCEEIVYGEDPAIADAADRNLRGATAIVRDEAGQRVFDCRNIDGLPLRSTQRVIDDVHSVPDWADAANVAFMPGEFVSSSSYDGLGRMVSETRPDGSTIRYGFERGGGLKRVEASTSDGLVTNLPILLDASANARGQRDSFRLGNGVLIESSFDPQSWRTTNVKATRGGAAAAVLQDMDYFYDPVGNIVGSLDRVQQPGAAAPVISGLATSAEREYSYDAFYQIRRATGRVHRALLPDDHRTDAPNAGSFRGTRRISLNDGGQLERFVQTFDYDLAGNMTRHKHVGPTAGWTEDFWVSGTSNRSLPALDSNGLAIANPDARFDTAGNLLSFPHLRSIQWDHRGMMVAAVIIDRSAAGQPDDAEYYLYDATGRRVRKRAERLLAGGVVEATDTLYLGGCEIRRITRGGAKILERLTSHVTDGAGRVAMIHRWPLDSSARETDDVRRAKVRYQLSDHLGSALLQLDEAGAIISYEEYLPYGGTAFIAGDNVREIGISAYRFCGKERDDATGLYCFGRRYYAPWLNRWISPDPAGDVDGLNRYIYSLNNPVTYYDPDGTQTATKRGELTITHGHWPPEVRQAFDELQGAEREQVRQLEAKGDLGWFWDRKGPPIFRSKAEIAKIREAALAAGRNVTHILPGSTQGTAKSKGSGGGGRTGTRSKPRRAANDNPPGVGSGQGHGTASRKSARTDDPAQAQDGSGGAARGASGGPGDSAGTGTGSDSGANAAHPGDGSAPGDHPGNGEGSGHGLQGDGAGGGGEAPQGTGTGTAAGDGPGTGKGLGEDDPDKSGRPSPSGSGQPGEFGHGADGGEQAGGEPAGETHPGGRGTQNLPGADPNGDPAGAASGSPGGRPDGRVGGDPAGNRPDGGTGTGGAHPPGAEHGSPGGGGNPEGSESGGGGGRKPEHWYEKVLATIGGVLMGAVDIIRGFGNLLLHPYETLSNLFSQMSKAYHEDGIIGAINVLNPAYHALVAGYEAYQAYERGDYFSMGRQSFHATFNAVATVGVAVGGAGLAARALGLGEASSVAAIAGETGEVASAAGDAVAASRPAAAASEAAVGGDAVAASRPAAAAGEAAATSDAAAASEAAVSDAAIERAFAEWEAGDASVTSETVNIRTTSAKMQNLNRVAESGNVRWIAGDEGVLNTFRNALNAARSNATGRLGFNLLRMRLGRRMTLNGPIHHWRFPMRLFSNEAMSAESLYLTEGGLQIGGRFVSSHTIIHQSVGLSRWPFSRMTPGMAEPGFQAMFNFWLR